MIMRVAFVVLRASESSEGMYVPIWTPIRVCWTREAAERAIDTAPPVKIGDYEYPKDDTYDIVETIAEEV